MARLEDMGALTQRNRKLVGMLGLIALIVVYAIAVMAIYINLLAGQPWWVLITFFAVAGLMWFFPAAWVIRWMAKPD
jgi:RsiW-degrading membrane proteinase PrsW (M82 family)